MKDYLADNNTDEDKNFKHEIDLIKEKFPDEDLISSHGIITFDNGLLKLVFPNPIKPEIKNLIIEAFRKSYSSH